VNALHGRQVDQQIVIERGVSSHIVATSAYGDVEVQRSRKLHRLGDIGHTVTARDRRRMLVDQAVVHPSPAVVSRVRGLY
jgi:hypothetical protein